VQAQLRTKEEHMGNSRNSNNVFSAGEAAWPASLALATLFGSLALACIFPFAAFAALAALTMKPARGLALIAGVWAVNQATGFFVLSFPWDAQALGHGVAILAATMAGFAAAKFVAAKAVGKAAAIRAPLALGAAFAVYQLMLRGYASFGGGAENFSAEIVSAVALNDTLWFAGLFALRFVIAQFRRENSLFASA